MERRSQEVRQRYHLHYWPTPRPRLMKSNDQTGEPSKSTSKLYRADVMKETNAPDEETKWYPRCLQEPMKSECMLKKDWRGINFRQERNKDVPP